MTGLLLPPAPSAIAGSKLYGVNQRVDQRRPTRGDDVNLGYLVGDLWRAPNGVMYTCLVNTAGGAVWVPTFNTSAPLPGNAAGSLAACYGMRRLVSGYAGNAFTVTRASDSTTLAINFLASGLPDVEALGKFLLGTTGRLSSWNDQSGNALNATQATLANMPLVMVYGDEVRLVFDAFTSGVSVNKWMDLPSGLALTKNACSAISMQSVVSGPNNNAGLWQIGSVGGTDCIQCLNYPGLGITIAQWGNFDVGPPPCSPHVVAGVFPASGNSTLRMGGGVADAVKAAYTNVALTGGVIGDVSTVISGHSSAAIGSMECQAVLFYSAALSLATDVPSVTAALHSLFRTCPQARDSVVSIGESRFDGFKNPNGQTFMALLQALLGPSVRVYNGGVSSATVSQMMAKFSSLGGCQQIGARSLRNKICLFNPGANDIWNGDTAVNTWAAAAAAIPTIQAAGFSTILIGTEPDRAGTAGQVTEKDALTALIRANAPALGCTVVDIAANPLTGTTGASANTTYFNSDGAHSTTAGAAVDVSIWADAITALIRP